MYHTYKNGFIEVVCGPMFAGKTEELIRRIKRLEYAKQNVLVFKPTIDNRYAKEEIVSHNLSKKPSIIIDKSVEVMTYIHDDTDAVVIDEVQFFDHDIVAIAEKLADQGIRVIVGGLDRDFRGEPFGPMPELLARAEFVTKLTAICVKSGLPATRTQRIINGKPANYSDPTILVGADESYEPRSRHYHEVPGKPEKFNFMQEALKEAQHAFDKNEVPVGAVVVYNDEIIARAHNLREQNQQFHSHAEFLAMMEASKKLNTWRLEDCDVYVTLEPCPMCAGAMIQSRIRKVYYAASDPKAGATDSLVNLFDVKFNHHVACEGGILAEESKKLLKTFFKTLRNK